MNIQVLSLFMLMMLVGCNPGSEVKIKTSGIFEPILFAINNKDADGKTLDFGEHILTNEPIALKVRIYNETEYPYTDLDIVMGASGDDNPSINFTPNPAGEINFPGFEGTCSRILLPKQYCFVELLFAPRDERVYQETVKLVFKNYVDAEEHTATLTLLAGMPASLVFTNDKTQYTFGELVGTNNLPVVEREDRVTYTEVLEVINAGGLIARNLKLQLVEDCTSPISNSCPAGMNDAYVMTHNCPTQLKPREKCNITVSYTPKNQDPASGIVPEEIKEINYRATINMTFYKDPTNATAGLNGHFRSISTNIEARFKVAQTSLTFDSPLISGTRETRTFRVNNLGYRDGEIRGIAVRDSGGALMGSCLAQAGSQYLKCFDSSNNPLSLADLPFIFKDRDNCINDGSETPFYVSVGTGCLFDITFQPSVTYLTNKQTEFQNLQPEVIYDSRWKGTEKILTQKLFNLSASSIAAARLVPDKFRFAGVDYPITGSAPGVVDMGRLALQSAAFFKYKPILLFFKNIGGTTATNLVIKDGKNRSISIGGTTVKLGAKNPYFYSNVVGSDSTCGVVAPGESCTVSLMFAPIGMDTNAEENDNMFDAIGDDGKLFKGFNITYNSGAMYTDTNIDAAPDYTAPASQMRMKADLIRKGMLMNLADDTRNVSIIGQNTAASGGTLQTYLYLRNIGTGPVPYIRFLRPPEPNLPAEITYLNTPDPAALGADFDCLSIADNASTDVVAPSATPDTRTGNFTFLDKDKTCVYTIQIKASDRRKRINSSSCTNAIPTATNLEEGSRLFVKELTGADMWEFCGGINLDRGYSFNYYDGDSTDPGAGSVYGNVVSLPNFNMRKAMHASAKLILNTFEPELTATMYRRPVIYPSVPAAGLVTRTVPEKWFYGGVNSFFYNIVDPLNSSPFVKGSVSRNYVPLMPGFTQRNDYDYVLYLGSFPQSSDPFDFPLSFRNFGGLAARITSLTYNRDPSFTTVSTPVSNVVSGSNVYSPLIMRFTPGTPGENRMEVDLTYTNGRRTAPLIFERSSNPTNSPPLESINQKILVIANVEATGTHPYLTLQARDYDVQEVPGSVPSESPGAPYAVNLTWNQKPQLTNLVFDTVKLTANPQPGDLYAKKVITLTNPSALPLNDLQALFRLSTTSSITKTLSSSFKIIPSGTTCNISGGILNPGQSCNIALWYQPQNSDSTDTYVMSFMYQLGTARYVTQNVGITLLPRAPGQVVADGITTETINYKITPTSSVTTRFSYPLTIGTRILDEVPKPFDFDDDSGAFKKITFKNTQMTKASLLLAYHKYLTANNLRGFSSGSPAPNFIVPDASEYRLHSDGEEYITINLIKYADNTERVRVEASRGCLFGDDETDGSIPAHKKGFNTLTVKPCYALFYFKANFEYLRKSILVNNGDDMRGTASEIWYYSVNRSSTASLWVHIKGIINPDTSTTVGTFADVRTSEARTASFTIPKFNTNNPALGNIVGVRVLMSTSSTGLNDPYATTHKYVDVRPYDPAGVQYALFSSDLANGQYFWFKAIPIRKDARFVDGTPKRFAGLLPGEYLSAATNTLKTLVPPLNHHWFHNERFLVEKTLTGGVTYSPQLTASERCTGTSKTKAIIKNPSSVSYGYKLITVQAWDRLVATPEANNYANMTRTPHWTSDAKVSIDAMVSALPGYSPGTNSQVLESSKVFYLRNSSNPAATVNIVVGGVPGAPYDNFTSFVDGSVGFASSRCMIVLPP